MHSPLTKPNRVDPERGHIAEYSWRGHGITVCDSARNVVAVLESFKGRERVSATLTELFFYDISEVSYAAASEPGDYEENMARCITDALWDVCGIDATPDRDHSASWEPPIFDWREDAHRIRASLLAAFGIDWDEASFSMSFSDMCGLLSTLTEFEESNPFSLAIRYRQEPPDHIKRSRDSMDAWEAAARHFALGQNEGGEDAMQAANDAMAGLFAAAERAAG